VSLHRSEVEGAGQGFSFIISSLFLISLKMFSLRTACFAAVALLAFASPLDLQQVECRPLRHGLRHTKHYPRVESSQEIDTTFDAEAVADVPEFDQLAEIDAVSAATSSFTGTWLYRSFLNVQTKTGGNPPLWGEGQFILTENPGGKITGRLDFGNGVTMKTTGTVTGNSFKIRNEGNSPSTNGWIYEHAGVLAPSWSSSTSQVPALVGSVLRTVAHGSAPAGVVGSFYAVLQKASVNSADDEDADDAWLVDDASDDE